jgi:hypothetical protein
MPNEAGRLAGIAIARSRSHYVAYGVDSDRLNGGAGLHGVLPDLTAYSPGGVVRRINERLSSGLLRSGMAFAAHRTGPSPVCFRERQANARCEQRFVPLAYPGTGPTAVLSAPLERVSHLTAPVSADLLPPNVRAALAVPRGLPTGPTAPRGPTSTTFAMPSGLYTDSPPTSDLPAGIESFGVEFECVVPTHLAGRADSFVERCNRAVPGSDGSINYGPGFTGREYTFWSTSIAEVSAWLSTLYGAGIRTNSSCGFHVHVKPVAGRRWVAATRFYWDGFGAAYATWARQQPAKFWERVNDHWCAFRPWTRSTVADLLENTDNRYTAINLSSLVRHRYGTIEHRILPYQTSASEAERSLRWLLNTSGRLFAAERIPVEQDGELDLLATSSALLEPVYGQYADLRHAIAAASIPRESTPASLPWTARPAVDLEA